MEGGVPHHRDIVREVVERFTSDHVAVWDGPSHARARRARLRDTDLVPHGGVAPEGAALPELSREALDAVVHPSVEDADGWYYEQPPFDLDWVLGPHGFDRVPEDRARPRTFSGAAGAVPVPRKGASLRLWR